MAERQRVLALTVRPLVATLLAVGVCATIAPYVVAVLLAQVAPFARSLSAGSATVAAGLAVLGTAAMLLAPSGVFLLFGMMGGAPAVTRSEFVRPMDILPPIPPRPPEGQGARVTPGR